MNGRFVSRNTAGNGSANGSTFTSHGTSQTFLPATDSAIVPLRSPGCAFAAAWNVTINCLNSSLRTLNGFSVGAS